MSKKSLLARNNDLANTERQLEILSNGFFANGELPTFANKIKETIIFKLMSTQVIAATTKPLRKKYEEYSSLEVREAIMTDKTPAKLKIIVLYFSNIN